MRRHLAALALASALAAPLPASAQEVTIDYLDENTYAVSSLNDFVTSLTSLGYDRYTALGAELTLTADAIIDFYFLGSESGFEDTFSSPPLSFTEVANSNYFPDGTPIGSRAFTAGSLAGELAFTSDLGVAAGVGDAGFGIFLQEGFQSGGSVSRFIIGYDDQITNPDDDNHDDLMILGVVRSAVPEPGTWAMLLAGFGMLGAAMRRKSKAPRFRAAIA